MPSSARKRSLLTPRSYLSWSQLSTLETSEEQYVEKYVFGRAATSTDPMEFGKAVAEGLEKDDSGDAQIETLRLTLPHYRKHEFEVSAAFNGVPLLSKFDLYDPCPACRIGEVKTGVQPWNQARVDNHGQLVFYNLAHFAKYGRIAKETRLFWAQTQYGTDGLFLTGRLETFPAEITLDQVLLFAARRIQPAWKLILEISRKYQTQIKKNHESK